MPRLIDAKLNWETKASDNTGFTLIYNNGIYAVADSDGNIMCEFMSNIPTAYDVAKVVKQLETKILDLKEQLLYTKDEDMAVRLRCKMHGIDEAIETIKAGGINEQ